MSSCFTRLLPNRRRTAPRQSQPSSSVPVSRSFRLLGFRPLQHSNSHSPTSTLNNLINTQTTLQEMTINTDVDTPPSKRQKTTLDEPKLQCRICREELKEAYIKPCRRCKLPECYECVQGQFSAAISDHECMPVRCCGNIIYHNVAKTIIKPAELEIYKQKVDEKSTTNPFYCPVPTCSAFIPPRMQTPSQAKVTCHLCGTTSCIKCKAIANENHSCDPEIETQTILDTYNYKRCPKCGTGIMRMFGCAHVRCSCGSHWCWDCQRPINACYAKPCSRARDDGETSQGDYSDSEDLESEIGNVVEAAVPPAATANTLAIGGRAPVPDSNLSISVDTSTDANTEPTVLRAPPENQPSSQIQTPQTNQQPTDVLINLDDPDFDDWENESLDFGDEPTDEAWDIWGCLHKFRELDVGQIEPKWLPNVDIDHDFELECMKCFGSIQVKSKKTKESEEEQKQTRDGAQGLMMLKQGQEKGDQAVDDENGDRPDETDAQNKKQKTKKPANKTGAYECKGCGAIYCWYCRRKVLRKVTDWMKHTGSSQ